MAIYETGFWWIFGGVALYGALHSLLASLHVKEQVQRRLGAAAGRWYRLFFNLVAGVTLLPVLLMVALLPDATLYAIPMPWTLLTLGLQGLGAVGLLAGILQTGALHFLGLEQALNPEKAAAPRRLTRNGLYRYVRHPLYSCGLLILWLTPWMSWNVLAFNLAATFYITLGAAVFEERKLLREFGDAYRQYQACTPMLIPGLRSCKKKP